MTAKEAASEYGLPSVRTLRTMRRNGLPAVRLGKAYLFDPRDIDAYIQAMKTSNAAIIRPPVSVPRSEQMAGQIAVQRAFASAAKLRAMPRRSGKPER